MDKDTPSELKTIGILANGETLQIALRLETQDGQSLSTTLTPKQACDLVAKVFHSAEQLRQAAPERTEALLPNEMIATKIHHLEAEADPNKPGEVLLRLSAGYLGLVLLADVGSLKAFSDWLSTHFAKSRSATTRH